MLFNSIEFLFFFPLVVWVYFSLSHQTRWIWLLLASCYFYMVWNPPYILLLLFSSSIDYLAALKMGQTTDKTKKRKYLLLSILSNLGILFTFKYFNFFTDNLKLVTSSLGLQTSFPALKLILPLGISFYTFQALSYAIDVYRDKLKPERNYFKFALYILFFPQLVAGPIERSTHLLPQFYKKTSFDEARVISGLRLMLWGLFQKLVIADNLSAFVQAVYGKPTAYAAPAFILATYFFAFQIYCDFAGYSNIAIGSARVLGFDLMKNFDRPYFATSVTDFWRRWHISLSTWFKDYLYIPLGGNRVSIPRWSFNILAVFIISGLWHGASWTFIIWGALHGLYMVAENILKPVWSRLFNALKIDTRSFSFTAAKVFMVFNLVCFAWIFFRANSLHDAGFIAQNLLNFHNWNLPEFGPEYFVLAISSIILMEAIQALQTYPNLWRKFYLQPAWLRWGMYSAVLWIIFLFGEFSKRQFIYFVF